MCWFYCCVTALQHVSQTGRLDKKPAADFKKCWDVYQRYQRFNQASERYTEPRHMQRTGGLFSDSEAERRGKHLLHYSYNRKSWNTFCLFHWSLVSALHLRTLVSWTLTTVREIWYLQWPTCLLLVLTPQQLHWDGLCCIWPNIPIYRVRE